ncbi:hypothetical protein WME90_02020 [Sorangium sp. So ce375]|uniref:hypothetical protein n=1 Tax=Sorangium sp. So ce375 TaxID=3133306 RepID=UPI003F5B5F15
MAQYEGNDTFPASTELVNDGTVRDAGSVNVPVEAALDRTVYLRGRGFVDTQCWAVVDETGLGSTYPFTGSTYAPNTIDATAMSLTFTNVRVGDIFLIQFHGKTFNSGAAADSVLLLAVHATDNVSGGGSEVRVDSAVARLAIFDTPQAIIAAGRWVATAAGTTRLRLLGRCATAGAWSGGIASVGALCVSRFRTK